MSHGLELLNSDSEAEAAGSPYSEEAGNWRKAGASDLQTHNGNGAACATVHSRHTRASTVFPTITRQCPIWRCTRKKVDAT